LDRDTLLNSGRYMALGSRSPASIRRRLLVGYFLDDHLHTAPLFTLLLTIGGLVGAMRLLLWSLKKDSR